MLPLILGFAAGLASAFPSAPLPRQEDLRPRIGLENITRANFDKQLAGRALSGPQTGTNFPDPSLIWGDGQWIAYGTGGNVPTATSGDGFSWSLTGGGALEDTGPWVDPSFTDVWAPDVNKNDDGVYFMYYAAQQKGGSHCIGVATSKTALGPYSPASQPLICDEGGGGVIDPAGYDDGKNRWILWKVDGNNLGGATTCQPGTPSGDGNYKSTPIKIQRVSRDGMTLLDSPSTILDNQGAANDGVVEAPTLWQAPSGEFVLFYSAHCYASDDYDVEYAWSSTINGQYGDRGVLFRTSDGIGIFGPGHPDIDPNGKNMVFHGRRGPNEGGGGMRDLYSATLTFNGRGISY